MGVHDYRSSGAAELSRDADREFGQILAASLPSLKRAAQRLCGNSDLAADMAQTAALKAWAARGSWQPSTDIKPWLFMILRNAFYSWARREKRLTPLTDEIAGVLRTPGDQQIVCDFSDTVRALRLLPPEQRLAVLAVGAAGRSHEFVASAWGCASGTVKSRVARGRHEVRRLLNDPRKLAGAPRPKRDAALAEVLAGT